MAELVNEQIAHDGGSRNNNAAFRLTVPLFEQLPQRVRCKRTCTLRRPLADDLRLAQQPRRQVVVGFIEQPAPERRVRAAPIRHPAS